MAAPTTVDEYLAAVPAGARSALEHLRRSILAAVPRATEGIAYGMPAVRVDRRILLQYAAFTSHCSLFPASGAVRAALGDELDPYFVPKATIRFRPDAPLPDALVRRIVEVRLEEIGHRGSR
jgi:uncharacterized protein YdhG (YjbR/CyaY superfamily)